MKRLKNKRSKNNPESSNEVQVKRYGDLTLRQSKFVVYYVETFDSKRSAIRAGYSPHTADVQACGLLKNTKIMRRINELMQKSCQINELTISRVLDDIEYTRLKALMAKSYGTALKCSELQGKYLSMFSDNLNVNNTDPIAHDQNEKLMGILERYLPKNENIIDITPRRKRKQIEQKSKEQKSDNIDPDPEPKRKLATFADFR